MIRFARLPVQERQNRFEREATAGLAEQVSLVEDEKAVPFKDGLRVLLEAHASRSGVMMSRCLSALSLAAHRTSALPHGLADIWLPTRDRGQAAGARRRRNGLWLETPRGWDRV